MRVFLDDVRSLPDGYHVLVRQPTHLLWMLKDMMGKHGQGGITHISFDHDLGEGDLTGYQVANKIEEWIVNGEITKLFTFSVHSANPVGAANIRAALGRYLQETTP